MTYVQLTIASRGRPLNRDVPPPSYEDAVDPNVDPPSYDSLFGRILDTRKTSRNLADFLLRLLVLLLGTIGCTVACSVTVVIPVAMIVVGAMHFHDCPAEPYIPVFLIVGGEKRPKKHYTYSCRVETISLSCAIRFVLGDQVPDRPDDEDQTGSFEDQEETAASTTTAAAVRWRSGGTRTGPGRVERGHGTMQARRWHHHHVKSMLWWLWSGTIT